MRLRVGFVVLVFCMAGGLVFPIERVSAGEDAHRPIASLNHFWAALDDETARAIVTSDYLKRFAHVVVNTVTAAGNRHWTGRYLRGRQTYAELFSVMDLATSGAPARIGASGIGISGDTPGVLGRSRAAPSGSGHPDHSYDGAPQVQDERSGLVQAARSRLGARGTGHQQLHLGDGIRPQLLRRSRSGKEAAEGPGDVISRERDLDDGYADHLMRDVTGLELAVSNDDVPAIEAMFRAAGFQVSRNAATLTAHGSDFDCLIDVVPAPEIGLRRVEFVLNGDVRSRHVEMIGHSTLTVGPGRRAVWTFSHSRSGR